MVRLHIAALWNTLPNVVAQGPVTPYDFGLISCFEEQRNSRTVRWIQYVELGYFVHYYSCMLLWWWPVWCVSGACGA